MKRRWVSHHAGQNLALFSCCSISMRCKGGMVPARLFIGLPVYPYCWLKGENHACLVTCPWRSGGSIAALSIAFNNSISLDQRRLGADENGNLYFSSSLTCLRSSGRSIPACGVGCRAKPILRSRIALFFALLPPVCFSSTSSASLGSPPVFLPGFAVFAAPDIYAILAIAQPSYGFIE